MFTLVYLKNKIWRRWLIRFTWICPVITFPNCCYSCIELFINIYIIQHYKILLYNLRCGISRSDNCWIKMQSTTCISDALLSLFWHFISRFSFYLLVNDEKKIVRKKHSIKLCARWNDIQIDGITRCIWIKESTKQMNKREEWYFLKKHRKIGIKCVLRRPNSTFD